MSEYQVAASADDGRELGTGDIEITNQLIRVGSSQYGLMRWTGVTTYTDRKVQSATVSLYTKTYLALKHDVYFEDAAAAATIVAATNNISARPLTTAVVSIDDTGSDNTWWTSPNLKAVLQEVIDTHGTVSVVAAIFDGLPSGEYGFRSYNFDTTLAPKLTLVFTTVTAAFSGAPLTGLYEGTVDSVAFTNNSITDDLNGFTGGSAGWVWEYKKDAGAWTAFGSGAFEPTLAGLTAGTYSIRLTATSNDGSTQPVTQTDYFIVGAARTATSSFTASQVTGTPGTAIDFTDSSSTDDPGYITSWQYERKLTADSTWSTFSVAQNPTAVSFAQGTWDVRLLVTTALGVTDTLTRSSYIVISASQISVFRPYGAPGAPLVIAAKPTSAPLIPTPTATGVVVRALVADLNNQIIGRIYPYIDRVVWRLGKIGQVAAVLARTDPGLTEEMVQFGRRVILEFSNGLPNWGGLIEPSRDWGAAQVGLTFYSGEQLLKMRQTSKNRKFKLSSVGFIGKSVLSEADAILPSGLSVGEIWMGGGQHSPRYHSKDLLWVFQDSLVGNLSGGAFDVTVKREGKHIRFYANLYERKGADKPNVLLAEGRNVVEVVRREVGDIINSWHMYGEGESWDDDSGRIEAHLRDEASIQKFGLREGFEVRDGVVIQATLDGTIAKRLAETAWPRNIFTLKVMNQKPALFADYDLGDVVTLRLPSYGFSGFRGMVRIDGREFSPDAGTCDLVVEEVR